MRCISALFLACLITTSLRTQEPAAGWTLTDPAGKSVALRKVRITRGTRSLSVSPDDPNKKPAAPTEFLEFREEHSTAFVDGIVTLVPLRSVEQVAFAAEEKKVTTQVLLAEGKKTTLTGTTRYKGINWLALDYEADLAGLGKALLTFRGGEPKSPGGTLRFPAATPVPPLPEGPKTWIIAQDKENTRHEVVGLVPLYQVGKTQSPQPDLHFRVDVKMPLTSIRKLEAINEKGAGLAFNVTPNDGTATRLVLNSSIGDPKTGPRLLGLLGRVSAGYKLFPAHTIAVLARTEADFATAK